MKKKHFAIILMLIVGITKASENEAQKELSIKELRNSRSSHYIPDGVTETNINLREINNSTISICIPLSVRKIDLFGKELKNSTIIFYAEHTPQISRENLCEINNSSIKVMHPLRQYTYHAIAVLCALGLYLYSQDK